MPPPRTRPNHNTGDTEPCTESFLLRNFSHMKKDNIQQARTRSDISILIYPGDNLFLSKHLSRQQAPKRARSTYVSNFFLHTYKRQKPGVRFSKLPKTFRARKLPHKASEHDFGCFSKHSIISDPRKVA